MFEIWIPVHPVIKARSKKEKSGLKKIYIFEEMYLNGFIRLFTKKNYRNNSSIG